MVSESTLVGRKAEELGVEIYPGFAASEILYDANHNVIGIGTNDMGIAKDGSKKDNFQRGVELRVFMSIYHIWFLMLLLGRVTLLAEGCRGSLSERLQLERKAQAQHQTYALGIKEVTLTHLSLFIHEGTHFKNFAREISFYSQIYSLNSDLYLILDMCLVQVWEIDEAKHKTGTVLHTLGWPLDHRTYGGSFLYHMNDRQVVGTLSVIKIIHAAVSTQMNSGPGLITLVFIIDVHLSRRSSKYHYYATSEALPMTYAVHYKINDFGSSCGDMFLGCNTQVSIGLVVALNYHNPFLNPYEEFQKLKHHPAIKPLLEGGTVLQYGARTLNEGGFQSIPYPVFPGGAIIGCSAGFLNVPKIKGTHTAMKSGMLAAEAAFDVLHEGSSMEKYWDGLRNSWIWEELHKARNYRPVIWARPGLALSALEHYVLKGRSPLTLKHGKPDHEATDLHSPIQYPKPDGIVSFDVPTSLYRSNTNHDHDQPSHLHLRDPQIPDRVNLPDFAGPESRYCPARVYEYVPDEKGELRLQINAQNCLHCKACDIKDPKQNIEWTVPEGGGAQATQLCRLSQVLIVAANKGSCTKPTIIHPPKIKVYQMQSSECDMVF
ncbi:hypothetical protein AAG906_022937 [Vitis piasezkii]